MDVAGPRPRVFHNTFTIMEKTTTTNVLTDLRKNNGFATREDYEFVLATLKSRLITSYGDLYDYLDYLMVRQDRKGIYIILDQKEYILPTLAEFRKNAKTAVEYLKSGRQDNETYTFGFGVYCTEDYDPETNKVTVSYDGDSWDVLVEPACFTAEYVDEAILEVVERFVAENESSIKDWYYED